MDTSAEYVKMCRKAYEIQELKDRPAMFDNDRAANIFWPDWYVYFRPWYMTRERLSRMEVDHLNQCIWLPRLDQLLAMMVGSDDGAELIWNLDEWTTNALDTTALGGKHWIERGWSIDRVALAWVMREKYGKRWNGEKWVEC